MLILNYAKISKEFHSKYFRKHLLLLPENLKNRIERFNRWQDAQSTLLGYLLIAKNLFSGDLRKMKDIQYTEFRKPFFRNQPYFNISHSGNYVVFIQDQENKIGVDIEEVNDAIIPKDFYIQMTNREQKIHQNSIDKVMAFYEYWTQKEAVVKCQGRGLSIPLKSFEILNNTTMIENELYYLKEIFIDINYKCFIASTSNLQNLNVKVKFLGDNYGIT